MLGLDRGGWCPRGRIALDGVISEDYPLYLDKFLLEAVEFDIDGICDGQRAWVAGVMAGSLMSLPSVWAFADITNALMVIPNVISLWALQRVLVAETKEYLWDGNLDKEGE